MKKSTIIIFLLIMALLGQQSLLALSVSSRRAIDAFRRYEPDFANSLRRLQELDRKIDNQNIEPGSSKYVRIMDEAGDKMDYVQRRYELMEDLFTTVSGDYPADRAELFEAFSRIDDMYRETRNFYVLRFEERENIKRGSATGSMSQSSASDGSGYGQMQTTQKTQPAQQEYKKVEVSGALELNFRNRNEIYRTQTKATPFTTTESALPNNLSQAELSLNYKFDDKRELYVEDRFLQRERNEPVHENYFTVSYLYKESRDRAWTLKNTLHHSWYPDNGVKDYRDNLSEIFYNERWSQRERLANLGYQSRVYPNYTRSDYHQFNLSDQETWFIKNGNIFAELKGNWRRYRNVNNLDYDNFNLYTEYNKTYSGNKADLSVSNTYDRRMYDRESVNLYRASYFDNYFRANYDLPVHDKLSYLFEGQYQKRNYLADEPRGYAQMNLFTAARFVFPRRARGQLDYRYIYNDENTRFRAHKNHKFHGMWRRRVNDRFKIRIDDTFHIRTSVQGEVMDFKENLFNAKFSWKLRNDMSLSWNNAYLARIYDQLIYRDYKYLQSGLELSYSSGRKYDWQIEQSWKKFSFRNGNNVSTGWESEVQPLTEVRYNVALNQDLKLRLRASWEKTYYRSFDTRSQELLWDFTRPMTITEFYGGLEYVF